MGHPARDIQEAIRRGARAGEGFGVIHSPNCPGHTVQKVSRAGDIIRSFLQGPDFNLAFPHDIQPKPLPHPASFCRALLQGKCGRGSSLGDGYLAQWTGALAS